MDDLILEKIAEQIKEGYTSGILDNEDGTRTAWSIDINTFDH